MAHFRWWIAISVLFAMTSQIRADAPVTANRPIDADQPEAAASASPDASMGDASNAYLRRGPALRDLPAGARSSAAATGPPLSDILWPLLVVIVLIVLSTHLFKRWLPRAGRPAPSKAMDVLARHYLSSKQSLCLVRLGRRVVFVGVTPDRITPLAEIQSADEAAEIVAAVRQASPGSFTSVLGKLTSATSDRRQGDMFESAAAQKAAHAGSSVRGLLNRVQDLADHIPRAEPT